MKGNFMIRKVKPILLCSDKSPDEQPTGKNWGTRPNYLVQQARGFLEPLTSTLHRSIPLSLQQAM